VALYFSRYPAVHDFMERMRAQAREQGYVETLFGRRLYLNDINARNQGLRAGAERAAINAPMQGTAADIIKRAMVAVDGWLAGFGARAMILQVHDELVFEVDEAFVPTLVEEVKRMSGAGCACRWWWTAASAPTGTRRIEALASTPSQN
jgi:DNA polymerase-1